MLFCSQKLSMSTAIFYQYVDEYVNMLCNPLNLKIVLNLIHEKRFFSHRRFLGHRRLYGTSMVYDFFLI